MRLFAYLTIIPRLIVAVCGIDVFSPRDKAGTDSNAPVAVMRATLLSMITRALGSISSSLRVSSKCIARQRPVYCSYVDRFYTRVHYYVLCRQLRRRLLVRRLQNRRILLRNRHTAVDHRGRNIS